MPIDKDLILAQKAVVRLAVSGKVRYGLWQNGHIKLYVGSPFAGGRPGKETISPKDARLLAPCRPSKIVAVGLNYRSHAAEMKMALPTVPKIFLKPSTSVIGPGQAIVRPAQAVRVDYEAELGVVIGKQCSKVRPEAAGDYILGYTCLNDVTERHFQKTDGQFTRAKGFDTFCPLGPAIAILEDAGDLAVKGLVNGLVRQDSRTSDLVFPPFELVSFISNVMTLKPGDVIATGTPAGIGEIKAGDTVSIEVEGVGRLVNPVKDA